MKLGNIEIIPISDGSFKLDGGAMFGVVPRVLWEKRMPPDDRNRISMGLWVLLVKSDGKNILVNTGIGTKYSDRYREIYDIQHPPDLISGLAQQGLKPDDINLVVLTHLHFDHCGGNTIYKNLQSELVPTFPNARYIIQKAEWANATNPNERTRASYLQENILPLKEAGVLDLIEGDKEIVPGIRVKTTGGHTRGHQVVLFESEGKKGVYWSDLIPTTAHIDLPYIMGYDLYPEETLNQKRQLVEQAINEKWLCFWEHDPVINCGYLIKDGDKIIVKPISASSAHLR